MVERQQVRNPVRRRRRIGRQKSTLSRRSNTKAFDLRVHSGSVRFTSFGPVVVVVVVVERETTVCFGEGGDLSTEVFVLCSG